MQCQIIVHINDADGVDIDDVYDYKVNDDDEDGSKQASVKYALRIIELSQILFGPVV